MWARRSCTWTLPARRVPWVGQPALHAAGHGGPDRLDPHVRLDVVRRRRAPGRDRLRRTLAAPFPLSVIAELLGIHESDREAFRRWSDAARVARPASRQDHGGARRALPLHCGAHRVETGPSGEDLVSLLVGSEIDGCPLEQGGTVHVPPDLAGGGQRDDSDAAVGDGGRPARPSGPARRSRGRHVTGAGWSGGVPALGHAGPRFLPDRDRGRRRGRHAHRGG